MSQIRYLTVDLVIESSNDLTPIVDSFGEEVITLYNGKWSEFNRAIFEASGACCSAANETIEFFCALVEGFTEKERLIWDSCFSKIFDIGYESGTEPQNYSSVVRPDTIKRIASIGAAIEITIYPPAAEKPLTRR
jgi:hypothetical protein